MKAPRGQPLRALLVLGVPPLIAMLVLSAYYAANSFLCGIAGIGFAFIVGSASATALVALAVHFARSPARGVPQLGVLLSIVSLIAVGWITLSFAFLRPCVA